MSEHGIVVGLYIAPKAGVSMSSVTQVTALKGCGLVGDRYCLGEGSWNKKKGLGNRQVTFINRRFIARTPFKPEHTRRNIVTEGVELMWLIGQEFQIGTIGAARFRGVKYCDPCMRPSKLSGIEDFAQTFQDTGGLIAEVLESGLINVGDHILPPPKKY